MRLAFQGRESRRAISAEAIGKFNAGSSPATGLKLLPQKQGITDGRLFTMADGRLFTTDKTSRTRAARLPRLKARQNKVDRKRRLIVFYST